MNMIEDSKTHRLMTRSEAADYLGVNRRTLEQWARKRIGPAVINLPSGRPSYVKADLDSFIASHRVSFGGEA